MLKTTLPIAILLSCAGLTASAQAEWLPSDRAGCTLRLKGQVTRTFTQKLRSGKFQENSTTEKFEYAVPGKLEETIRISGEVRFTFTPAQPFPGATQARLSLSSSAIVPLVSEDRQELEGTEVAGMGAWYFEAPARGGELRARMANLFVKGKVLSHTQVPPAKTPPPATAMITSVPLPDVPSRNASQAGPALKFIGNSLWGLRGEKAPFTAPATVTYNETVPGMRIQGKVEVQFELRPEVRPDAPAAPAKPAAAPKGAAAEPKKTQG